MKKVKILFRVAKKGLRKVLHGDFNYRGRSIFSYMVGGVKYFFRYGPKNFIRQSKQFLVSVDRRLGNNLAFPNGLITGADKGAIKDWYYRHAKKVTIVIPSYNDEEFLVPCIESLKETTDPKHTKIIIVDDYCQPSSRKFLKELEDEQVSVVYGKKNVGFAKAVNAGINAADKSHDIVLLNSDTVAHADWLESLQFGAYEFGTDVGIVGPKLLYPDGRIQSAGSYRNTEAPQWFDHYYRFQDSNYGPANIPQYCLGVTGACMYVKREVINYIGILDENFAFAFEDMDWCLRGWRANYRSLYFPAAVLTHKESASRPKNKDLSPREKQSIEYFWKKWGDWFDKRNVKNAKGKKRVIFVLQSFGLSGGIKNIFELANRLHTGGFAVEIWGIDHNTPPWHVEEGLKVRSFKNYERLINALSDEEAIKVATWWETAFPVWLSSVNKGVPVYFISEFETWFYPDDVVAQATVVSCYRKEFRNITISSYNLDELKAIGLTATIIPCGYDDTTYRQIKDVEREGNVLLGVGRSFFQKNFEMTFKGWRMLGEDRPEMWLYGFETEMEKRDSKITYFTKPSNQEVNELYNKATLFVQTSRHEGFCLPILEAMAAGCPVICTDAHGNRDFSFDGKNCLIVGQDDAEGLSRAIRRMLDEPELREKLSKEALRTVKNFQWGAIMKKADKFFKEVK
jgi:GT2 family glycosyltransferase/glycosyltransferase involved in cell wall biosynthesis